ncbi:MAG: site-specific integrase [Clostridia bacterium]|nr:site-specific integrase [Clostridia bacterium]
MKGSVRKKGASWSYRIELGLVNGKRNQIERSGYKTKREAEKALNDVLYQYNNTGDYIENKKITFTEVYTEFIENEALATRAYATIVRYKSLYNNHFKDRFGPYYMYQITANSINDFLNEKRTYLSEEFVKGLYKFLKVLFGYAHKRQYTKKDIFESVTAPPDPRHVGEIRAYTADELAAMEERLQGTNVIISFYIALNTGMRESEIFGLQWSDVDFEASKIKVHKQLLFQDKKWCFCPLKTKNAYRSVNITDNFCEYLKSLKEQQAENKVFYEDGYKRNFITDRLVRNKEKLLEITDFINVKPNGEMLTTNSIKFMANIMKNELNIPFKFHNLRHTFATVLAESGVSPKYVQETLGHAKLEFTLRYYTHITEKMGSAAKEALEGLVSFKSNKENK